MYLTEWGIFQFYLAAFDGYPALTTVTTVFGV